MKKNRHQIFKKLFNWVINLSFFACIVFLLFLFAQVFFVSSFRIPSDSMEPSLQEGDYILVNKLIQGARIFNLKSAFNDEKFTIHRMPGIGEIKRNDVLVFNFPYAKSGWDSISFDIMKYYVKRCIALPNDTLEIRNGFYKITNKNVDLGNQLSQQIISNLPDSCKYIEMVSYPFNRTMNWSIKNFGPLYIPAKGKIIAVDSVAYILYHQLISWEQNKRLMKRGEAIYLGDSIIDRYQFKENYYFVGGDKCENSQDSRYWGLLPESFIVGKATTIWNSKNPANGKIRWNRVLKEIQ